MGWDANLPHSKKDKKSSWSTLMVRGHKNRSRDADGSSNRVVQRWETEEGVVCSV